MKFDIDVSSSELAASLPGLIIADSQLAAGRALRLAVGMVHTAEPVFRRAVALIANRSAAKDVIRSSRHLVVDATKREPA